MKNKVITMCDSKYFPYGHKLLDTRKIVDADFVCYGPDLKEHQQDILRDHDIQYKKVNQDVWDTWMQSLKFQFIMDEIEDGYDGITFVDWDTYFLKDWGGIFYRATWDLGITVRQNLIDSGKTHRAWANGGVIFGNCNGFDLYGLCEHALRSIEFGVSKNLPEYDEIWKTLEEGRKPEKTHHRTDKRWWCDQVYLSAIVKGKVVNHNAAGFIVKLFDCKQYNNIWEETPDTYIMHLKEKSGAPSQFKDGK